MILDFYSPYPNASLLVMPAKAGIPNHRTNPGQRSVFMGSRLRGNDQVYGMIHP